MLYGEAQRIDAARRCVVLENGEALEYDYLIVATGSTHSYFGRDEWAADAPGLKTLEDAFEIRRRILLAFEHAERETVAAKRAAWLTFVVVGGGATGVEMAGTMAEIARYTLRGEFRVLDSRSTRVVLVEGTDRVLPTYPPELSERARVQLERLGVTVWRGRRVTGIDAEGVWLSDPAQLPVNDLAQPHVWNDPLGRSGLSTIPRSDLATIPQGDSVNDPARQDAEAGSETVIWCAGTLPRRSARRSVCPSIARDVSLSGPTFASPITLKYS